jgi:hypothetical protein
LVVLAAGVFGVSFAVKGKGDAPVTATMGSVDHGHDRGSVPDAMAAEPHPSATPVAAMPAEIVSPAPVAVVASIPVPKPAPLAKPPTLANPQPVRPPPVVSTPPVKAPPAVTEKKKPIDLGI